MADRSAASGSTPYRDLFAEILAWRLTVLGAAALGFLVTFILLDHEILALKNVTLPLLVILPAYLFLVSLNTWWAARSTAQLAVAPIQVNAPSARHLGVSRALQACGGVVFGVITALWYVHSVSH